MLSNNVKTKIKGAVPAIGLVLSAMGLTSAIYWTYLGSVSANAKEALSIGNENTASISKLEGQMNEVVDNSKYTRDKVDKILEKLQ